ncbi:hypothetical protein F4824DRAFT_302937 [Ustulina deusta]|nr:hypothetical protein F4824DRAFT_302937 [Ustulina deusta]
MSYISTTTDRDATKEPPEASEHKVELFCHFTARYSFATTFHLQVCTRKWLNFSKSVAGNERTDFGRPNTIVNETESVPGVVSPLGTLKRLPLEVRYMIYDLVFPPTTSYFDFSETAVYWPHESPLLSVYFAVPKLAHVCREMRQYAMPKYQLVWWTSRSVIPTVNRKSKAKSEYQETTKSGFGVFQPDKDVIKIYTRDIVEVELAQRATVEWDDPTKPPILKELSTRQVRYPPLPTFPSSVCTSYTFIPKELGLWERTWTKDCHNKFRETLRKI